MDMLVLMGFNMYRSDCVVWQYIDLLDLFPKSAPKQFDQSGGQWVLLPAPGRRPPPLTPQRHYCRFYLSRI